MGFTQRFYIYLAMLIALLGSLTSCDNAEYGGPPRFILYVEDTPADYTYLRTSIEGVELQRADGTWEVITKPHTLTFDLLSLCGGTMLKIADQIVPEGDYIKLRVRFTNLDAALGDQDKNVKLPIASDHIIQEFDIKLTTKQNVESYLIMDINAVESVVTAADGTRSYAPKCKVQDLNKVGTLWGMVGDPKGVPIAETMLVEIKLESTLETVTYTYVNRNTAGFFARLLPGTYKVTITPNTKSIYSQTSVNALSVDANNATHAHMVTMLLKPPTEK